MAFSHDHSNWSKYKNTYVSEKPIVHMYIIHIYVWIKGTYICTFIVLHTTALMSRIITVFDIPFNESVSGNSKIKSKAFDLHIYIHTYPHMYDF